MRRSKAADENQYVLRLEPKGEAGGFSEILLGVEQDFVRYSLGQRARRRE